MTNHENAVSDLGYLYHGDRAGKSQRRLARTLTHWLDRPVSQPTVNAWLNGNTKIPEAYHAKIDALCFLEMMRYNAIHMMNDLVHSSSVAEVRAAIHMFVTCDNDFRVLGKLWDDGFVRPACQRRVAAGSPRSRQVEATA